MFRNPCLILQSSRVWLLLSIAMVVAMLGALLLPARGLAIQGNDPIIELSSKGAPACSDDENASCASKLFTVDFEHTASYEFDCHGSPPVPIPWLKWVAALFGVEIPLYVPDPTPETAICFLLAQGSIFRVYENGNPIVEETYIGLKHEGQFTVQPNLTYELKLIGHGRDFREIAEANGATFDSFANVTYQEIDPPDESCQNPFHPDGLPYSGNLDFSGDHDWQRIKSDIKGTMILTLDVPPDKDYQMEVRNDACSEVLVLLQNGTGVDEQFVMSVNPAYYRVHVYGKDPDDFGARYSVSALWDLDDSQWENAAFFDVPFQGNLEYSGDRDWQRINVPAAGTTLVLDVPDGKNYDLELWRDDVKSQVATSANGTGTDEHILINEPGYYRIHIFGADPTSDFGAPYRVLLTDDDIAPSSTIVLSGTQGDNDWYLTGVEVALSATDNPGGSGVQKIEYGFNYTPGNPFMGPWNLYENPFVISIEGHNYLEFRSTDKAGNVESNQSRLIMIDKTPPNIVPHPIPSPNSNGWYNADVEVGFEASDFQSGIASLTPANYTFISEGADQSVTGTAIDNAGNSATFTIGNINIDKTPPTITIIIPEGKDYLHSASFDMAWSASDSLSGIATSSATLDGQPVVNGQTIDLFFLTLGSHTVALQAHDMADNGAGKSMTFNVVADIDSLLAVTQRAYDMGWIEKQGVYTSLDAKLKAAQRSIDHNQLSTARKQLLAFINKLETQKGKSINQQAYDLLKADALYVMEHLP